MKIELVALIAALLTLPFTGAGCRHAAPAPVASISIAEHLSNDRRGDAEWCGSLRPGTRTAIHGHVSAAGADTFDGYAFASTSACTVRYRLRPTLPGTDLDLCAVDLATGSVRQVADGEDAEETGTIRIDRAGIALELVVSSAWGSSSYALEIEAMDDETARATADTGARRTSDKHTIEKLEAYLGGDRGEEPAASAGVLPEVDRLADRRALLASLRLGPCASSQLDPCPSPRLDP